MIAALFNKVNMKRWWMTSGAVFAWIFATDFVIHGWYLGETYQMTANLWRSQDEMRNFMGWMTGGQALIAIWLSFIFTKGYENKGWQEGVRYGFLIGLLVVSHYFMQYATTPMPMGLFMNWIWTGLAQCVGAGVVASLVYKK